MSDGPLSFIAFGLLGVVLAIAFVCGGVYAEYGLHGAKSESKAQQALVPDDVMVLPKDFKEAVSYSPGTYKYCSKPHLLYLTTDGTYRMKIYGGPGSGYITFKAHQGVKND